jgi:hypothetical protein
LMEPIDTHCGHSAVDESLAPAAVP